MRKCPALNDDSWEWECENVDKYYCPVAAIPFMIEAIQEEKEDCPLSWQVSDG